jgi:hypothetical protein
VGGAVGSVAGERQERERVLRGAWVLGEELGSATRLGEADTFHPPSLQDEIDPRRQLDRFAQQSPKMALKGLRQAINDLLEMTRDFHGAQLEELDRLLGDAGAPTISELRLAYARKVFQILRAGVVTSDEDYRLLAAVLSDVDNPLLSTENRDYAERILASYSGSSDEGA